MPFWMWATSIRLFLLRHQRIRIGADLIFQLAVSLENSLLHSVGALDVSPGSRSGLKPFQGLYPPRRLLTQWREPELNAR